MTLKFSGSRAMQPGDEDRWYRITVMLAAIKRPRYWRFHCPSCKALVCELSGNMIGISDVADATAIPDFQPAPLRIQCSGRCNLFYEFVTLSEN